MQIHEQVKQTIKDHKNKVELFQWAVTSGVASLVYSEFIRRIKQKNVPTRIFRVPSMKNVKRFMDLEGPFMEWMSANFIDYMREDELFKKYADAPELVLFKDESVEILKTIFDLYILRNISTKLPETIAKKFQIGDPKNQIVHEDNDIDLFSDAEFGEIRFKFIVHETVLQLLSLLPTMRKEVELPEENIDINMTSEEIFSVANENALCPIHFDKTIIEMPVVTTLLFFVTNTTFEDASIENIGCKLKKGDVPVEYIITTGAFNQVSLTKFIGIEYGQKEEEH